MKRSANNVKCNKRSLINYKLWEWLINSVSREMIIMVIIQLPLSIHFEIRSFIYCWYSSFWFLASSTSNLAFLLAPDDQMMMMMIQLLYFIATPNLLLLHKVVALLLLLWSRKVAFFFIKINLKYTILQET